MLLLTLLLTCCEEELPEVSFRIVTGGFHLDHLPLNSGEDPPDFAHRVSGGIVRFTGENGSYRFDTKRTGIEDYLFHLPAGMYELTLEIPMASLYGQDGGSFTTETRVVPITAATDSITIEVRANCALFLVRDDLDQLEDGIFMIERHSSIPGYFRSYPLSLDTLSGLYFGYFTPDTVPADPSAFLWFYRGEAGVEEGGLPTAGLETGYQYLVTILE